MNSRTPIHDAESTLQRLDPIAALGDRILVLLLASGGFGYFLISILRLYQGQWGEGTLLVSVLVAAAASIFVIVGSSQKFSPFRQGTHYLIHLSAIASVVILVFWQNWHAGVGVSDAGSVFLGVLLLALGPYRPAIEIAALGSVSGVFIGFIALIEAERATVHTPLAVYTLTAMAPCVAFALASAKFSGRLVSAQERWRSQVIRLRDENLAKVQAGLSRSVRKDRLQILEVEAFPFLNEVIRSGTIGPEDRSRALRISNSIREIMVTESDRTWLEVAASDDGVEPSRLKLAVADPQSAASFMTTDQRTAIRAMIWEILSEPAFKPGSLRIELATSDGNCIGAIRAHFSNPDPISKGRLAPYLAVMRVLFSDVTSQSNSNGLLIGFGYAKRDRRNY
ncbi:MAG: hypothetical protein IT191_06340 [Microbacteriaceae bacterium]|nr:hypothetical protein [Microbacteriaceae bacterium]